MCSIFFSEFEEHEPVLEDFSEEHRFEKMSLKELKSFRSKLMNTRNKGSKFWFQRKLGTEQKMIHKECRYIYIWDHDEY